MKICLKTSLGGDNEKIEKCCHMAWPLGLDIQFKIAFAVL